ncbi:exonuclease domain-containing protein [Escherichia coli]
MTVSNNLPFFSRLRNLWHAPALDRPAQFAAIRTDSEFNVIGEPEVFYCKPADNYLPQPEQY